MKHDGSDFERRLRQHLGLFGSPSASQLEVSRERIRARLQSAHDAGPGDAPLEVRAARLRLSARAGVLLAAAAAAIVIVVAPWSQADALKANPVMRFLAAFTKGMIDTAAPVQPVTTPAAAQRAAARASAAVAAGAAQPALQEFETASVKPCDPDHLPQTPDNGRGGGANSMHLTPGRLRALCVTPATLVRVAYGYSSMAQDFNTDISPRTMTFGNVYGVGEEDGRRVRGGADWVRSERYTIEAVTGSGVTPDAPTLRGPMLQRVLERRFQLKTHIESEQAPAFALAVAKGGLKITPVKPDACDELPARPGSTLFFGHSANVTSPPRTLADVRRGEKPTCGLWGHRNGPNQVMIGGDLPLEALLLSLGVRLGGVRVVNRTGVAGRFNFVLEFALDENTPGLGFDLPDRNAALDVPAGATIFTALEEQLGLKLERAQASRDFVVIDRIERPAPN